MVGYLSKEPKTFLWMIQENFTGKGDVQHKLEGPSKSPRESPPPSQDAGRPFKIKRRMEKTEMEKEAQHLKAAKARSTCEVFIMMKMLETHVGQLVRRPMGNKE